jgi:Mrp family chromosome partitioning ATPase
MMAVRLRSDIAGDVRGKDGVTTTSSQRLRPQGSNVKSKPSDIVQKGKKRISQGVVDALLLAEIEAEIDEVSPDFSHITKEIRNFAGRYVSGETPHRAVLGVLSPRPNEGRTTVAIGLAGALAEIYSSVVLVEMETDRTAPTLCTEMNLGVQKGLRDYIGKNVELEEVLRPTEKENLWFVPAGPVSHQASRLDATARTRALLSRLSQDYEVVLVDLPPVLTSEEAPALLAAMDAVVLVVNAGSTTADDVRRALALCGNLPVRGVFLNQLRLRAPKWLASLVRS